MTQLQPGEVTNYSRQVDDRRHDRDGGEDDDECEYYSYYEFDDDDDEYEEITIIDDDDDDEFVIMEDSSDDDDEEETMSMEDDNDDDDDGADHETFLNKAFYTASACSNSPIVSTQELFGKGATFTLLRPAFVPTTALQNSLDSTWKKSTTTSSRMFGMRTRI